MFIDGLDEFDGDHLQLALNVSKWSGYPHFRVCVSSRPWNVFSTAFKHNVTTFRLEDLTQGDISHYVAQNLQVARRLVSGLDPTPKEDTTIDELASTVVTKAAGVFLWVFLVAKSLTEGIIEGDSITRLHKRVEKLPSDLYEYFKLILQRIDGEYVRESAQTLLLAANIAEKDRLDTNFLTYWHIWQSDGDLDSCFGGDVTHCNITELLLMRTGTQRFLSACCKDLLQLSRANLLPPTSQSPEVFQAWLIGQRVEFLHRTVYEFIRSDQILALLNPYTPTILNRPQLPEILGLIRLRTVLRDNEQQRLCFCSYFYDQASYICHGVNDSTMDLAKDLDRLGQSWLKIVCPLRCIHYKGGSDTAASVYSRLASYGMYALLSTAMATPL